MANKILVKLDTTPKVFADLTDYAGDGGARNEQIDLTSLPEGEARQSNKENFPSKFPHRYIVTARIEYALAPAVGDTVGLYFAPSLTDDDDAGGANPGGISGQDSAYTGTPGSTLEESLKELQFIGSLMATQDASPVVQQQTFKMTMASQYGSLVVVNTSSTVEFHTDAVEMSITFTPYEYEVQ